MFERARKFASYFCACQDDLQETFQFIRWLVKGKDGSVGVADADQFALFYNNKTGAAPTTAPVVEIEKTTAEHFSLITKELKTLMKNSLNKDRWDGLELHTPKNYSNKNVVDRWTIEKNKWLSVSYFVSQGDDERDLTN